MDKSERRPSIKQIIYYQDLYKKLNGCYYNNNVHYNFSDMSYEDFKRDLDAMDSMSKAVNKNKSNFKYKIGQYF